MERLCEKAPFENMIGNSAPMQKVFQTIQMLSLTDVTVLIRGETGTGKDMAARAIHGLSARKNVHMVTVNCPALPETILESELFGHRKGAFTSANQDKKGLFDQAHGGTIFLDEIGDLSLPVQTKLLRVLEDKQVMPLGDSKTHEVDVRIITATNQNLEEKIQKREFREDLYYRLNVASLQMPPLDDIRSDIPLLADHFVKKIACENNAEAKVLAPEVVDYLLGRSWPGNIRELENTIRGWCALTADPVITLAHTGKIAETGKHIQEIPKVDVTRPYKDLKAEVIDSFTMDYLRRLLEHTSGNISLSAQISGIKRQSLQKIIKRYNVSVDQYRL
jgi:transcriptional regulator with GAF, ATPase, and Fis domain